MLRMFEKQVLLDRLPATRAIRMEQQQIPNEVRPLLGRMPWMKMGSARFPSTASPTVASMSAL
jgi:hypothetical protein